MFELIPHPDFPSAAVATITVSIDQTAGDLSIIYSVTGALDRVRWPAPVASARADELWKHTCFEAFIGHPQEGYTEYNFSPSGEWAAYFFDWYRDGMRPATWLPDPVVDASFDDLSCLRADIDLSQHWKDGASHLALSAVIEEINGNKSYWALAHPPGNPDFHNRDCFTLRLPAPNAP